MTQASTPTARGLAGSLASTVAMLVTLVAMLLPLPGRFVAVLPCTVGVWQAVLALRDAARRRGELPVAHRVPPMMNLVLATLLFAALGVQVIFYSSASRYEDCVRGANTNAARAQCESGLRAELLGRLMPTGFTP